MNKNEIFPCEIQEKTKEIIKAAAVRENVSEFSILSSAILAAVRRYTGCDKANLNVRSAGSSTMAEIDLPSTLTMSDLFKQLHLKLGEIAGSSQAGGCDIEIELPGDVMRPVMRGLNESTDSEAAILFRFENAGEKTFCKIVYSGKYYPDKLLPQMARHFINVLSNAVESAEVQIKSIAMLDAEDHAENRRRGTGPKIEIEKKCAHRFFEEQAAEYPDATALIYGKQRMSYKELNARANAIGHFLQSLGVGPETIVGIGMERNTPAIICMMAILKAGGAFVFINTNEPDARIREMLSSAQISLVITESSLKRKFGYEGLRVIDYAQFAEYPEENTSNVVSEVTVYNTAFITFTSGYTGKPKGVKGTHLCIATQLDFSKFLYEKNAANVVCSLHFPLSFGAVVGGIFLPLCCGIPLAIIREGEEKDPYKFACHIGEHKVNSIIAAPALARQLYGLNSEARKLLESVEHIGLAGAEIIAVLAREIKQAMPQVKISVGYAGSEIGIAAFGKVIEDADLKDDERIPLGEKPGPNMQTYIVDRDMNEVPAGVPGELCVSARYISPGYVGMPELTARRFIPNPFTDDEEFNLMYRTGDILRYRFDDRIEYIGRADNEVKIRGFRIDIEEAEAVLRNHEAIEEAVVTIDKGKYSERLVAWIVRKPEAEIDISELRRHIKKYLPDYMVPSLFIFMKQLPLNANGKIDRMALSFDAAEHAASSGGREMPRNQLESAVSDIWRKMLEQELGIHDDFLDLGGDSIQAGLISLEIREQFNVEIPIIMFFEDLTVAKLAEIIYSTQENGD